MLKKLLASSYVGYHVLQARRQVAGGKMIKTPVLQKSRCAHSRHLTEHSGLHTMSRGVAKTACSLPAAEPPTKSAVCCEELLRRKTCLHPLSGTRASKIQWAQTKIVKCNNNEVIQHQLDCKVSGWVFVLQVSIEFFCATQAAAACMLITYSWHVYLVTASRRGLPAG